VAGRIPAIGRNPPYIATFAIFVILTIPAALTDSFAGLLVTRFLMGFFGKFVNRCFHIYGASLKSTFLGSPCLATAGASFQDMVNPIKACHFDESELIKASFHCSRYHISWFSGLALVTSPLTATFPKFY
jgi:MFS family permease